MYIPFHLILFFGFSILGIVSVIILQAINYFKGKKFDKWALPAIYIFAILGAIFYSLGN